MDSKALLQAVRRRPVTFIPGKKVVSTLPGEWTSPYEGKGYEPLGYRDFTIGDDPRRINLPASARRGEPTIVERVALRDFKVLVVVDRSPSMRVRDKNEIQLAAAALLLYSAWQSETTFGFAVRTDEGVRSYGLGIGSRHFYHLYRELWELLTIEDRPLKGRRMPLSRCLPPNAMLLYCSDFLEPGGEPVDAAALLRAVHRYDFIPVIIQDELEYSFPVVSGGTFLPFSNPETGSRDEAWISPATAREIRAVHEARYRQLEAGLGSRGVHAVLLDSPGVDAIGKRIDRYFGRRKGRQAA